MSKLRFRYQTVEFDNTDIHVRTLRDRQQFSDTHGIASELGISAATWPIFGIIWDSGEVLAHLMFDYEIEGKRILEIGCGIGLSSLVLNERLADITATDHHPEAEKFLVKNTNLNNGRSIPFVRADWKDASNSLGKYDLIIGSDLLYEKEHIELLANFINQHASKSCEVIIVDPGRGQHASFSKEMVRLGYLHTQRKPENTDYLEKTFRGQILQYAR